MKVIHQTISYLLLILFALYQSQGVIVPYESSVGPILLLSIFAISFVYLIKIILSKEKLIGFIKAWILFYLITILSFLFSGDIETELSILKQILINFLPFFPAYYFAKKGFLTKKHLILFLLVLLPILSISFFQSYTNLQFERGREDVVSNAIYPIIGLLPFVFLLKRKILSFGVITVIWFLAVQSSKRVAIVAGLVVMILFIYQSVYLSTNKNKIWSYLVALFVLAGVTYFAYDIYQQNIYLQQRMILMMEGSSSGRDLIIEKSFNAWYHSDNIFNYLFGLGFNHTRAVTTHVAHNDWMDVLGSYGLVGLFLYISLWVNLIKISLDNWWGKIEKLSYISIIMIALIASMVFRWYISPFPFMNAILLPYLLATKNKVDWSY